MPLLHNSERPQYSFENDISGRLFSWLIESGRVDFRTLIEQTAQGAAPPESWVERLSDVLKAKIGQGWLPPPQPATSNPPEDAPCAKAPGYNIWFRPSPSKKIKFKEVARALLIFTGQIPPTTG